MNANRRDNAQRLLKDSLKPVPSELNALDWKGGLSDKSERLAQHLSAYSNLTGGGVLVYGIDNDGVPYSMEKDQIEKVVKKLSNIAKNNLSFSITIEHAVMEYMKAMLYSSYSYQNSITSQCTSVAVISSMLTFNPETKQ